MNVKTTFALLILVGAGVLLWWYGGPKVPPELDPFAVSTTIKDEGTRAFLERLQPEKIAQIEVTAPRGTTQLSRKPGGVWTLPGNWPIREPEVNALVDYLAALHTRFQPQAVEKDENLKDVGLNDPTVTVELKIEGESHTLSFGERAAQPNENRFSHDTYLRLDKKPEILRLAPGVIAALNKPTDYYQQRRLFPGERVAKDGGSEKVEQLTGQSIRIEDKKPDGSHVTLTHRGNEWQMSDPVRDRLDAIAKDALLAAVPDIWAEQFVQRGTSGAAAAILGLLRARTQWTPADVAFGIYEATEGGLLVRSGLLQPERVLTVKNDKGDSLTLQIGAVSGKRIKMVAMPPQPGMPPGMQPRMMPVPEEYRYARIQGNDQIFEIKGDKLKDVFVALDTLRDSRVARFNSGDARRLEIQHGGEDIVLEKDKDNWKLVKPLAAEADNGKVTDLLGKLSELQARDKDVLDKDDPKKYGFDKPEAVIRVTVEAEDKTDKRRDAEDTEKKEKKTRTLTVRIGKHDKEAKKLYVQSDDWPRINVVEDSLQPLVVRSALAYRGKRVFDFSAADVAKIDIDNQGKPFSLEHDKENWRLAGPMKADADAAKVEQLAGDLGRLETTEYVNQSPKKDELEAQYGLGKPPLTVRVEFTDKKKPPQVLRIGKSRGSKGGYFAQLATDGSDKAAPVFALSTELHNQLTRDVLTYRPLTLWQVQPEDVLSLRIQKMGQKDYELTRSANVWKISGPFEANALSETAQTMATELGSPKIESYKTTAAKTLAEFGLDKPTLTIHVKARANKEYVLLLGKTAEGTTSRYAKRGDDPAVFLVGDALSRAADHSALDLLDTRLLHLDAGSVARLHTQAGDKAMTLEKKGDAWQVSESPAGAFPADMEVAASLPLLWTDLRAERFVDYGSGVAWAKYGLGKPAVRVKLGAGKNEHTIDLGKEVEGETGARYVRVDNGAGAAVLPLMLARLLERGYLDYVNHNVLKFDSGTVTELQRHVGPRVLEVLKKDDAWELVKPTTEKADDKAMQQLCDQLGELRAERIAAFPVKDLKEFGLDAPWALVTVKLKTQPKATEHVLKLGKTTGHGEERFARVDDGKTVVVLSSPLVERLLGSPLTFRDRTIARFSDADRLQLERGPRNAVFSKIDGTWKLTEPLQSDAEQDALDDFVNTLARLRADALIAEKPDAAALKSYGLDRPEARWKLQANEKEVLSLIIGDKERNGSRRYAKLAKGDLVFLLDARLSQKVLDEYRPRTVWNPPLDAVQVESLNYRYDRNPFLLEKVESNWQAVGKPDAKLNAATVEETLAALSGLKLSRYAVDKDANLALFGLDKPYLVLEAATRSGKRTLHVGNVEGNSKGRYARVADSDRRDVFVLDEETCARLLRDLPGFGRAPTQTQTPAR